MGLMIASSACVFHYLENSIAKHIGASVGALAKMKMMIGGILSSVYQIIKRYFAVLKRESAMNFSDARLKHDLL